MSKKVRSYVRGLWQVFITSILLILLTSFTIDGIKTFFNPAHKGRVVRTEEMIVGVNRYSYEVSEPGSIRSYTLEDSISRGERYKVGDELTFYVVGGNDHAQFHRGFNLFGFLGLIFWVAILAPGVWWLAKRVKAKIKPKQPGRKAPGR